MFRLRNRIDAAASRLRKRRIKGDAISEVKGECQTANYKLSHTLVIIRRMILD